MSFQKIYINKNIMRKLITTFILISIWISSIWISKASNIESWEITYGQFITYYLTTITQNQEIQDSYRYIDIKYTNVKSGTYLHKLIQKWVYLNVFPNVKLQLPLNKKITQKQASLLIKNSLNISIPYEENKWIDISIFKQMMGYIQSALKNQDMQIDKPNWEEKINTEILNDVYQRLKTDYLYSDKLSWSKLEYESVKWMVNSLWDNYSNFYAPSQANDLNESLEWEYEWIWAYVEKTKDGKIIISSPIKWWPAEKAWILAWDQIIKVGSKLVNSWSNINTVVSRIKWKNNTTVKITILRWSKEIIFSIKREKVEIKNIEAKILESWVCYIDINLFDFKANNDFSSAIENISKDSPCEKYIFDLRDNPWGSLDEVANMLQYFVPKWETILSIKWNERSENYKSAWQEKSLGGKISVLINWLSASASEIFAGVIKEYVPSSILIWEKTFWKWTVQSMIQYMNGSILKYTIAKRYTGKEQKNIDWIWFQPNFKILDNKTTPEDEQLEFALDYNFTNIH